MGRALQDAVNAGKIRNIISLVGTSEKPIAPAHVAVCEISNPRLKTPDRFKIVIDPTLEYMERCRTPTADVIIINESKIFTKEHNVYDEYSPFLKKTYRIQ
jgi:hypothetical protein